MSSSVRSDTATTERRVGSIIGVVVNVVMIWVVHRLLVWGWPGFLTQEFDDVLPLVTLSLVVSAGGYLLLVVWATSRHLKQLVDVISTAIGAVALVRILQVYPFDFSGYDTNWSWLVRTVLIVALIGSVIGLIVGGFRLSTWPRRAGEGPGVTTAVTH